MRLQVGKKFGAGSVVPNEIRVLGVGVEQLWRSIRTAAVKSERNEMKDGTLWSMNCVEGAP